ncbi:hypothetical protein PENSPDRAFT_694273 [Peniophora sp. CONT]|nr:hypothetical protein PENSPDRAFT_694273 [Peniophora sp. CONT]
MSLVGLNTTEKIEVVDVLFRSIASSGAPLVLLESFMTGILCICVPLATYLLWVKPPSLPRVPILSVLWIVLIVLVTHWALSLRQLELTFVGRPLGSDIPPTSRTRNFYALWGPAWQKFLPTVTETVLCGTLSVFCNGKLERPSWSYHETQQFNL